MAKNTRTVRCKMNLKTQKDLEKRLVQLNTNQFLHNKIFLRRQKVVLSQNCVNLGGCLAKVYEDDVYCPVIGSTENKTCPFQENYKVTLIQDVVYWGCGKHKKEDEK